MSQNDMMAVEPILRQEGVAFEDLLDMSNEEMKELGIVSYGHRKKLIKAVADFRGDIKIQSNRLFLIVFIFSFWQPRS